MRVLFRADGSGEIGSGHVMRCLTLAAALREQGAEVRFVARSHAGHLGGVIAQRGFPVVMLPWRGDGRIDGDLTHASWVGASWEGDADETRAVVDAAGGVDWLVVDHYGLDKRWERRMRPSAARLLVVDDLADRMHDCDLLLDQNLVAGMESRYDEKLPPNCGRLLGPGYALLDREFAGMHLAAIPRQGAIGRLFIFFGAADRGNLTGRCLDSFLRLG
ncbi:MAG: UDP-2,4-diacetamido-2,4,6-trideoxy-beta-L-altropyranose hydrolase, partial [Acidobacteria bacterium]|nr:UDP-2,4-diacetamido-2,4,6-trideoxy-beta-L-altropyranose hydrolase [Acidobacteriota bacterium]